MSDTTSIGLVQQFIQRTERLYSLPAVALEVLRLTSEPRVDAGALKNCIRNDPALTARILRAVNSSLFAPSRQVTDLNQALGLLGMRPLKMLVLGFSLPPALFQGIEAEVLARYWRRTLIKAVAARELAQRLWQTAGDEAFTAGLMQDLGVLVLVQQLGSPYLQLLSQARERGGSVLDYEQETIGFDHVVLSARLLAHWGLPAVLCSAVAARPEEEWIDQLAASERTLPQILHLADLLASLIDQPYGPALRDLLASGGKYRGLTYERLQPLFANLQRQVEELAAVLSLELPAGQSYLELLAAAQERLADETASAVSEGLASDKESEVLAAAASLRDEMQSALRRPGSPESPRASTAGTQRVDGAASGPAPAGELSRPPSREHTGPAAAIDRTTDSTLLSLTAAAVQRSRQHRCPVSLALVAIDRYGEMLLQTGPAGATDLAHWLRVGLTEWTSQRTRASLVGESTYAILWEDCPRSEALELTRRALEAAKRHRRLAPGRPAALTLSGGLATLDVVPRNFRPQDLIDAAQRCLDGAQLSGGDTLKSIAF